MSTEYKLITTTVEQLKAKHKLTYKYNIRKFDITKLKIVL
jgi:hypothetical protein